MKLHHIQISMPRGGEDEARRFYGDALGLQEVQKPPSLVGRGGCWFRAYDGDAVLAEIHLGVDDPFHPARRAHPAFVCASLGELEATAERIERATYERSCAARATSEGYVRCPTRGAFGTRAE